MCKYCEEIYFVKIYDETLTISSASHKVKLDIPNIMPGTKVYIINKEHKLFLEQGTVCDLDHKHCRILFKSLENAIDDRKLWVPASWISELPEELR
jgi:hypothetical protein